MASSSSSCSSSSSSIPQNQVLRITLQELFTLHNIDRELFSRLVFNLWHDPAEAMHVTAFWMWLECFKNHPHYVDNILNLPDPLLEAVLEETLLCLRATEVDPAARFRAPNSDPLDIPTTHSITGMDGVSPWFFHEYRVLVLLGVGNITQQFCVRAFLDLIQMLLATKAGTLYNYYFQPQSQPPKDLEPSFPSGRRTIGLGGSGEIHLETQTGPQEIAEDRVFPSSERTIFLTFSKGYLVSKSELRKFLTRSFGNIIEALYMQEVGDNEQPLYARLMVPDLSTMVAVLSEAKPSSLLMENMAAEVDPGAGFQPPNSDPLDIPMIHSITGWMGSALGSSMNIEFWSFLESDLEPSVPSGGGTIGLGGREVGDDQQPLYARLMVPNLSAMVAVSSGQSKAKFFVNGKHVDPGAGFQPPNSDLPDTPMIHSITGWMGSALGSSMNRVLVLLGVGLLGTLLRLYTCKKLVMMSNPICKAYGARSKCNGGSVKATKVDPGAGFRPPDSDPLDIPMIHSITGWMRADPLYNYYFQPQCQPPKGLEPNVPSGGRTIGLGSGGEVVGPQLLAPHPPSLPFYSQNLGHGMLVYYPTYNPLIGITASQRASQWLVAMEILALTQTGPQEMAEDRAVPSSEMTIFLTFSKGYPISENELREFLARYTLN
ncbi:hypothetical protein Cgig2_009785 [Carnegiea gigantea]|uniref:Uncharacterized protein n=1 Tax=Carnegiea gigantea TaxID=171969 RepID=A0A9Q1JQ52_9CARY|nr:hypothetical protein Cgig2_009785 [Carnegiea gigantea]